MSSRYSFRNLSIRLQRNKTTRFIALLQKNILPRSSKKTLLVMKSKRDTTSNRNEQYIQVT